MSYEPKPIDTGKVVLPAGLAALAERLAANTHDLWARCRLDEGWRWGAERDDPRRLHPNLIAYEDLAESEKQIDRRTTLGVLKTIAALGWQIKPPECSAAIPRLSLVEGASSVGEASSAGSPTSELDLRTIWRTWHRRDQDTPIGPAMDYADLGERAVRLGEPLLAYDILREGVAQYADDVRLQRLQALVLARSGALSRAREILLQLEREKYADEETLALLARVEKDLWQQSPTLAEGKTHLEEAIRRYGEAYRSAGGYWSGINFATLCVCAGRKSDAVTLADRLREDVLRLIDALAPGADAYWMLATMAEAYLVLDNVVQAEQWYGKARAAAARRYGDLATTRRNAKLLLRRARLDESIADRWLPVPRVLLFSGHMFDRPDRQSPRFPAAMSPQVALEIATRIRCLGAGFGYASASSGADVLFLEAMREAGGETHVVLGCPKDEFLALSAAYSGSEWLARCGRAIDSATTVTVVSEQRPGRESVARAYSNHMLHGLSVVRALQLGAELSALAVWDGQDRDGGTADNIRRWTQAGRRVEIIRLDDLSSPSALAMDTTWTAPAAPLPASNDPARFDSQLVSVMFADAVGFSRLDEQGIPPFVRSFLGLVARVASKSEHHPMYKNTWGDGLYFVFTSCREAGLLALELCDQVAKTDWSAQGLPRTMNLRIGLHAGPVYECFNPVTARQDFFGTHVSRAARIEPVTPPGHVYASQNFAAVAAADEVTEFKCEYIGQMPLAKGYGTYPTFHVQRAPFSTAERMGRAIYADPSDSDP